MNREQNLKMIADISNANGVSGFEDSVVEQFKKYTQNLGESKEDSLRNFYVYRKNNTGKKPVVQLDAHSDEVGFMVRAIKPNGTIQFINMGGWVPYNIPAHRVRVRTKTGEYITGIVASKPPHFMSESERNAPISIDNMVIDVGARSAKEAIEEYGIRIGEPVVPDVNFEYDQEHDLMIGKGFDCRLGCCTAIKTFEKLADEQLDVDLVLALSSQEEVGIRGSKVTSNVVRPDIAVVFEGCPADDTFMPDYLIQTAIKQGPMLRHIDASMITNPRYQRFALDIAEELGIPVQDSVRTGGSTNGGSIHLSNMGVPVIVIGLPVRYIHTHYGIASYEDFDNAVRLACEVIKRLSEKQISMF